MRKLILLITFMGSTTFYAQTQLFSPSKEFRLTFSLTDNAKPTYSLDYKNKNVIAPSLLGIAMNPNEDFLNADFKILKVNKSFSDTTWEPVLGEVSKIRDHYNQITVELLQTTTERKLNIEFRLYDEGLAFRYVLPTQYDWNYFQVERELTQFKFTDDHEAFWIPGDFDSQEYVYNQTPLSGIDVDKLDMNNGIGFKGQMDKTRVQSPLLLKTKDKLYISIFEAAVINYPVMHLFLEPETFTFRADLAPNALGKAAYLQTPCKLPWRTVMVSDDARDIVASKLILNLNEPSKIEDTSWIKPMKYVGIWWEMHVGKSTWDYAGSQNAQNSSAEGADYAGSQNAQNSSAESVDYAGSVNAANSGDSSLKPTGKHGATTANAKRYIDFAAKHGFGGVLIEGWNVGWEDWFGNWKEEVFDFVTPYPDFDIQEVTAYAKSKKIELIMHHETSGSVANYERRLDRAFDFMKKHGYNSVKTGYVGKIIPRGEAHDGQTMVNHFNHVVKRAAEQRIMVNSHESVRPTGVHRTWPNYIAAEAARGNEFNAWSVGNPPMHETVLPFTRLLGGPMDYTPGIFELKMSTYDPAKKEQVQTTLAKQLALYVTLYSPLQMAADLPENYEKHLDAFQFIKDVAADWSDTKVLEAEPGDYLTIARKAKGTKNWFVGAITDEKARETVVALDFLEPGRKYTATIYEDAKDAHWQNNPKAYVIRKIKVDSNTKINLALAPGGGAAISILSDK